MDTLVTAENQEVSVKNRAAKGGRSLVSTGALPRFERTGPDGELYLAHRFGDGRYRMANPAFGRTKHHSANQLSVELSEIVGYLKEGYLLRMRGENTKRVNLIAASEIRIILGD